MPKRLALVVLLAAALAAAGYYYLYARPASDQLAAQAPPAAGGSPPAGGPGGAPPPEVGVVEARPAEVALPVEYAARVAGVRDVEVRAQVGGLLLGRDFAEGSKVAAGHVLFRIDPATYQVALERAEAELAQARAALRQAEDNFARADELARRQVAAQRSRDDAIAQRDQARASVQLAEAAVAGARLNLGYTTISAPVAGVTALESPPVGTLIQPQQTLLTTITPLDPAYVSFSFTDEEGRAFRELNQRRAVPIREEDLVIELRYGDGSAYPQPGRIDTAAQRVDPRTGTIEARAVFPNPDGVLLPGQFVRVAIRGVSLPDAIVIPDRAVSQGPQGPSLFVVAGNGTAEARPVRLGQEVAGGWVVQEGLRPSERVVVDGVIRVRPGAPVRPVPADPTAPEVRQAATTDGGGGTTRP